MDAVLLAATRATVPDIIVFVVAAIMILAGAIGVVTARNPVHAALMLVATLFGVAVIFIEQQADFLAAVQVIVYAGAVVVLFLFVIMFLGVDQEENVETEPLVGQRPVALVLVLVVLGGVIALAVSAHWITGAHTVTLPINGPRGEVGQLGHSVFTTYLFAFEATAALLVTAVVGAVVLARRPPPSDRPRTDEYDDRTIDPELSDGALDVQPVEAGPADEAAGVASLDEAVEEVGS